MDYLSRPKSPCRQDCPYRDAFCKIDCDEYKEYEERYRLYNEEKEKKRKTQEPVICYRKDIMTKRKIRNKRKKRNGK